MTTLTADAPTARFDRPVSEPWVFVILVLALTALGIVMVYSAGQGVSAKADNFYFTRHLMFVPVALAALTLGVWFPYQRLNRRWVAWAILGLTVLVLALVLVPGIGAMKNGARRWFTLPFWPHISIQPSEFAKVALVIFLSWFLARPDHHPRDFRRGFLPAMAAIGLVCALIAKEDLGTAVLIGTVGTLLVIIAGCRWFYLAPVLPVAGAGAYVAVVMAPFRVERLLAFLNPWEHMDKAGWHVVQSLLAIGRGGLFGVGLGAGVQKFGYLPEDTTDFIFAALCEEMGLLGGILVIGVFAVFVWRGARVVRKAPDSFGFLLASGLLLMIALQAIMNIGVVSGALPCKGIGLPFLSYGGTGLVVMSLAAGLLASVARGAERAAASPKPAEDSPKAASAEAPVAPATAAVATAAGPLVMIPAAVRTATAEPQAPEAAPEAKQDEPPEAPGHA